MIHQIVQKKAKSLTTIVAALLLFIVAAISFGGFFSDFHWRLAWYSNPRPHLLLPAVGALAWFLLQRNRGMAILAAAVAVTNLVVIAPLFFSGSGDMVSGESFSLLHINTNKGLAEIATLSALESDIIFLQEHSPELDKDLETLFPNYYVVRSHPLANTHGSAILLSQTSDFALQSSDIIHLPETSNRPLIYAKLRYNDRSIHLLNLHIIRPHHSGADAFQKRELAAVAQWSRSVQNLDNGEVVIAGDLNTTPWLARFYQLLDEGNLQNSLQGYGLQNTWASGLPLVFGLPIDHALHSKGIAVVNRKTIALKGTDHAALFVEFGLTKP